MVRRGFAAALDFLLPRKCVVCESILGPAEMHICSDCLEDLPRTYYWIRKFNPMADKFNALIQKWVEDRPQANKDDCLAASEGSIPPRENYAYATALFFYRTDSGYSNISRQLKYHGDIPTGRCFGRMLGEKIAGAEHFADVDTVIPIPLHWTRKWSRGYNQAEIIAREVASALGAELRTDILERRRRTRTQTKLTIEGKAANVQGAFSIRPGIINSVRTTDSNNALRPITNCPPRPCRNKADAYSPAGPKHLLLVDDVFTTGSTLHACYAALREVFPLSVRISVATLAFVGEA
jgi:predicted amidophosphoribosyltransferase